jgi:hypothetical protein
MLQTFVIVLVQLHSERPIEQMALPRALKAALGTAQIRPTPGLPARRIEGRFALSRTHEANELTLVSRRATGDT